MYLVLEDLNLVNKTGKEERTDGRVNLGRRKGEALFPAAPPLSD